MSPSVRGLAELGLLGLFAAGSLPHEAGAQPSPWSVIVLTPPGASSSVGVDVWGGQQVGSAMFAFPPHAALWEGSAGSWKELPAGELESYAEGVHTGGVVGYFGGGSAGYYEAVLWVDGEAIMLHPSGAQRSLAFGIDGAQQVGAAQFSGAYRAGFWTGTAASWVDLHPAGAGESVAGDVHDGVQVGSATIGGARHACLWRGTRESWVDLHPAGATESWATDVHDGEQVGRARIGGQLRAGLWRGDAESWLDLTPPGATSARASGVHAGRQVGEVTILGRTRAVLWSGTPESLEDLSVVLGAEWEATWARSIWSDGDTIYVVGSGHRAGSRNGDALMWMRPIETPCYADCDGSGRLDLFDFLCFQNWFAIGYIGADCDSSGSIDYFDFLCFQNAFAAGCP